MKYNPLFCRVIIKVDKEKEKNNQKPITEHIISREITTGQVVKVADGTNELGKKTQMQVQIGDFVIFNRSNAINIESTKFESYYILHQNDILAVRT